MEANHSQVEPEETAYGLEEAIQKRNYLHAERLARHLNRPDEEIRRLQEKAFMQYVLEYRNAQGAKVLAEEFGFSKEEVSRLLAAALEESGQSAQRMKEGHTRRFDMETMGYLSLEEWTKRYFRL